MNRLMKMATVVVGVGAMFSFAGCGDNGSSGQSSTGTTSANPLAVSADSAKEIALKKLKDTGFDKVEFVSEKNAGDKSVITAKITSDGSTEETKVYCSKINGKWTVTKLD